MGVRVKGRMYCPSCRVPVQASKQGHGIRNSVGAVATLGLSVKIEDWSCPVCGTKCLELGKPGSSGATPSKREARAKAGAKVEWRCEKHGHLVDRRRDRCLIDDSPAGWRAKPTLTK